MTVAEIGESRSGPMRPSFMGRPAAVVAFLEIAATAAFCCLLQSEWPSVAAPFWGPWAGMLHGHRDCTMATVMPTASRVVAGFLAVAALAIPLTRRSPHSLVRSGAALLFVVALGAWCLGAVLSFVNMAS